MGTLDSSTVAKLSTVFGGGLAAGIIMSKLCSKLTNYENNIPEKWVRVGNISQLIIYPVKSLPGIQVNQAVVTTLGLQDADNPNLRDRTFLITNSKGDFQTQRGIPSLALVFPTVNGDVLELKCSKNDIGDTICVPFPKNIQANKRLVRIYEDKVSALDCGDDVAKWLDRITGSNGLRMVYHESDKSQRKVAKFQKAFPTFSPKDTGTFQDETSYMMMTEESIDELNSKLEKPVSVRSFRPSILMNGSPEPWAEDFWTFIRIGSDYNTSPLFKTSRPCQRCKLTTNDPDTGIFRDDGEPVKTLRTLKRKVGDEVVTKIVKDTAVMGTHFGVLKNENAVINVGDPIYAAVL